LETFWTQNFCFFKKLEFSVARYVVILFFKATEKREILVFEEMLPVFNHPQKLCGHFVAV